MNKEKLIQFIETSMKATYSAGKAEGARGDFEDNSEKWCKISEDNKLLKAILGE